LATECCQIVKTADPLAWRENVIKKQVTLEELETASFEQVYLQLVEEYVDSLGRSKSLMERISLLNAKCQRQRDDIPRFISSVEMTAADFRYDESRIRRLDKMRQDIVHRLEMPTFQDDIIGKVSRKLFAA
jgi:hypothetical protein